MKKTKIEFTTTEMETNEDIKISIEGLSDMPFWNHDLKLKAVKVLLSTVDIKDYFEENKEQELEADLVEIQELLSAITGME